MNTAHIEQIETELNLSQPQVAAVVSLLKEGSTIPFIARYRKEATGSLDEVAITAIRDRLAQLEELDARKETVLNSLEKHGHLTDELKQQVLEAPTLAVLEDIYLPYKPKRKTRATKAKEKGLEPLALLILEQRGTDPVQAAQAFIDPEKEVLTDEDALQGARDIIAEIINEDQDIRAKLRDLFTNKGVITSKVAANMEEKGVKYKDYFEWSELVAQAPSHRILAMRRGENEEMLNLDIAPSSEEALAIIEKKYVTATGADSEQVRLAVADGYKRLLSRSMEAEVRLSSKTRADAEAIQVFAQNLRELLLASPLGAKRVMGIDPGFRTGCKLVCLNRQGKLLCNDTIYLHEAEHENSMAAQKVLAYCAKHEIQAIAIGNGTAGRETEAFVKSLGLPKSIIILMVNEAGASVYSASKVARDEFPDLDLTVRGAISIGRRLQDPLAELVKIDPKSIGVGQYQHDVDQTALKNSLDDVVISCVNAVGVDANQASAQLLTYVSGLGPQLAKNIITFRDENGAFDSRDKLKEVPRLGPKAFEQCAGFLRIKNGSNPLDSSAVHPESYPIVYQMAKDLNCDVSDLIKDTSLRKQIDLAKYVTDTVGLPTLKDIMDELAKPGRDPREKFEEFAFAEGVQTMEDLQIGMKLPGIVTNVTAFGAFIDVGVHQDGLAHISELADHFVKDPSEVVKVHQKVMATVLDVDINRKRISLSLKTSPGKPVAASSADKSNSDKAERKPYKPNKPKKSGKKPAKQQDTGFNNPFSDFFNKNR